MGNARAPRMGSPAVAPIACPAGTSHVAPVPAETATPHRPRGPLRRAADAIDRLNEWVGRGIQWFALLMVLIGAFNAVARYATKYTSSTLTSNALIDLQWYLFSLIFLLGAAYGLKHDVHVRVDVLYSKLSDRGRAWIDLCGSVLFLLPFCVLMLYTSWPAVRNSWAIHETSPDPGGLPRYPLKAVILVSFVLLFLQGLSRIVEAAAVLRGESPEDAGLDTDHHRGEGI